MPSPFIEDLLIHLNSKERKSVIQHYSSQQVSGDRALRRYIEGLMNGQKVPIAESNRMIKSRAFDQLTDILTSNYHIHNKENFPSQDQLILRLKKKILFARVISKSLNQNRIVPFKTLLNTTINDALKAEVYEVLIEALLLKKYFFALKEGNREFEAIDRQIVFYEQAQKKVYNASDCYFKIIINNNLLRFKNDKDFNKYINNSIRILKSDFQKYKSQQINYYLHIILMFYFERQKKYSLSVKYCKILLSIVKTFPVVYREDRVGFALDNLSQYKTFTSNYNEAARYAKEAQRHYLANSNNYLVSKEQEFTIYFYHKKYEKAADCMEELRTHKLVDSGTFAQAKYIYYQAALFFEQQKFKQALNLLNKSLEIEKDKSRWNISLRILNIMLYIELNKIDEAARLLESLRKFVERHKKTDEIKTRDVLIVKVLREMEKAGFNIDQKNKNITKMIRELSQKNKPVSWEHYSPELIPFHEWLLEKSKIH